MVTWPKNLVTGPWDQRDCEGVLADVHADLVRLFQGDADPTPVLVDRQNVLAGVGLPNVTQQLLF